MAENDLKETFFRDARRFRGELSSLIERMEKDSPSQELLEEAYRLAHSLKSESSYVDYQGLARIAHEAEEILEAFRTGKREPDAQGFSLLRSKLTDFDSQREALETPPAETSAEGASPDPPEEKKKKSSGTGKKAEKPRGKKSSRDSRGFGEFEYGILRAARKRGETLYRLTCRLEDNIPMKFAKAYLLINNLELLVTVLKVVPDRDVLEKEEFSELEFIIATDADPRAIYNSVNVDQVDRVELGRLSYEDYLPGDRSGSVKKNTSPKAGKKPKGPRTKPDQT